jgi:hypothetical protein
MMLLKQDGYQLEQLAVKQLNKEEYAVRYLNSLNLKSRSQDGAGSRVSEAAVKARPRTGQANASQVRYRGGWLIKNKSLI